MSSKRNQDIINGIIKEIDEISDMRTKIKNINKELEKSTLDLNNRLIKYIITYKVFDNSTWNIDHNGIFSTQLKDKDLRKMFVFSDHTLHWKDLSFEVDEHGVCRLLKYNDIPNMESLLDIIDHITCIGGTRFTIDKAYKKAILEFKKELNYQNKQLEVICNNLNIK